MVFERLAFKLSPPFKVTVPESSNLLLDCATQGDTAITWKRTNKVLPRNHMTFPNGTLLLRNVATNIAGTAYTWVAKNALRSLTATSII